MVKKKIQKTKKKKKPSKSQIEKWVQMASAGKGQDFLKGVKMLGGIPTLGMGMGPGTHH